MEPLYCYGDEPLKVSVAVPLDASRRTIRLRPDAFLCSVVIVNVSHELQKVWAEDCSAGSSSLTLEVVAVDGQALPQKSIVEKRPTYWRRNVTRPVTIEPAEALVREVRLHQYTSKERLTGFKSLYGDHTHYAGFPALNLRSGSHLVRMRAVFSCGASENHKKQGIWSGQIVSEERDYTIWGQYL